MIKNSDMRKKEQSEEQHKSQIRFLVFLDFDVSPLRGKWLACLGFPGSILARRHFFAELQLWGKSGGSGTEYSNEEMTTKIEMNRWRSRLSSSINNVSNRRLEGAISKSFFLYCFIHLKQSNG